MRATVTFLQILVRLCFLVNLVLGIGFWTGHWFSAIPWHMAIGIILVIGLWCTSLIAAATHAPAGLVVAGLLWGVIVIAFGMTQMRLLPGSAHWVIQVLHLLVAMGAIALNERMARFVLAVSPVQTQRSSAS